MSTAPVSPNAVLAATIESVFPDAPKGAAAPESARTLFRFRMRRWRANNVTWLWLWWISIAAVPGVTFIATVEPRAAGIALLVVLVPAVVLVAVQWHRASNEFFEAYAVARGLQLDAGRPWISCDVPLLHKGDEREFDRVLTGRIGDASGALGQYTYTDVTYTTDSNGNRQRQEHHHHFTVVAFSLPDPVAARFHGVYCREHSLSFGALQDKLAHDRGVELESADFSKRYSLRVVDGQDDIALYELFSTSFIEQLTHRVHAQWEQAGSDLVVFWEDHRASSAELDELCWCAQHIYRRYCEEYQ